MSYYGDESLRPSKSRSSSGTAASSSLLAPAALEATLNVKKDAFWIRMFFGADLGFSEAFMADEVDTPDLGSCFDVSAGCGCEEAQSRARADLAPPRTALHSKQGSAF